MCERCDKLREGATSYQDIADAARKSANEEAARLRDAETPLVSVAIDLMQRHESAREGATNLLANLTIGIVDKVDLEMCATSLDLHAVLLTAAADRLRAAIPEALDGPPFPTDTDTTENQE